jgi:hypothetical protein
MGPTKAIVKANTLYEAASGKLIKDGFCEQSATSKTMSSITISPFPWWTIAGNPWLLEGKPVYCFRGSQYETLDDQRVQLARCPDCGGNGHPIGRIYGGVRLHSACVSCGHEFDARLEMNGKRERA